MGRLQMSDFKEGIGDTLRSVPLQQIHEADFEEEKNEVTPQRVNNPSKEQIDYPLQLTPLLRNFEDWKLKSESRMDQLHG